MKKLILNWVASYMKNNWQTICEKVFSDTSIATYLAKVLQWLLSLAAKSGNYTTVRKVASYVIEQGTLLLSVTEDNVITSDESKQILDNASKLLGEWFNKSDYSVTDTLRNSISDAVTKIETSASTSAK